MSGYVDNKDVMKYLIHDVAQLVNLAPGTIRKYEEAGILKSVRNEITGYRYFHLFDINVLMRVRMYRSYGMSLKEIKNILYEKHPEATILHLKKRMTAIEKEIEWQKYILSHLKKLLRKIAQMKKFENRIIIAYRPALYGLLYRDDLLLTKDTGLRKLVNRWMSYMPLSQTLFSYQDDSSKDWDERFRVGLCIDRKDAEFLGVCVNQHVFYIEPCPAVYTIVPVQGLNERVHDKIPEILNMMKAQGLLYTGTIYVRTITSFDWGSSLCAYNEYWIPFKEL
jgi:DNA-binding transcriptional MerR regulator